MSILFDLRQLVFCCARLHKIGSLCASSPCNVIQLGANMNATLIDSSPLILAKIRNKLVFAFLIVLLVNQSKSGSWINWYAQLSTLSVAVSPLRQRLSVKLNQERSVNLPSATMWKPHQHGNRDLLFHYVVASFTCPLFFLFFARAQPPSAVFILWSNRH